MRAVTLRTLICATSIVAVLTGCASDKAGTKKGPGPQAVYASDQAMSLAQAFEANPGDLNTALAYSKLLRRAGDHDNAVGVLMRASVTHPDHPRIMAEFGKAMVELGQPDQAIQLLEKAEQSAPNDWSLISAKGVAFDQMGMHAKAQANYHKALQHSPGNPSVLTNLGLSYAIDGDLKTAEASLRRAVAHPSASSEARINLALVVGLQGRFQEAEEIAAFDLPPAQVAQNVGYLREILKQPDRWRDMERLGYQPASAQPQSLTPLDASIDVRQVGVTAPTVATP